MSTRDETWPNGTPSWADLMTTDRQASWDFYHQVLGWEITDSGADMGHYGMAAVDGREVAGIGEAPPGQDAGPVAWTTYLAVDDVDKTSAAIPDNGGTVLMPPMDVGGAGRMAIAADPTGAVFGMWQRGDFIGARLVNEPGAMVWNECMTRDTGAARAFYTALFGHEFTPLEDADGYDYTTIKGDGPGGVMPAEVPSHWRTYFAVENVDATIEKAVAAGASVSTPAMDTPYGRMAGLSDPQGGMFMIMAG
jgi:uncharacterized protein